MPEPYQKYLTTCRLQHKERGVKVATVFKIFVQVVNYFKIFNDLPQQVDLLQIHEDLVISAFASRFWPPVCCATRSLVKKAVA